MSGVPLWLGIVLLAAATLLFKALGPVTSAGRRIPAHLEVATGLLPTALIAGLLITQTFDGPWGVDAKLVGVVAAVIAVALRAPFAVVVLVGAATAAGLRALGLP
jgi:uncharacterized membrane protein